MTTGWRVLRGILRLVIRNRWPALRVGRIGCALQAAARRPGSVVVGPYLGRSGPPPAGVLVLAIVVIPIALAIPTPHTHITADPNAAALFRHHAAELRALGQTGKLLGAVDDELLRLDLHAEVKRATRGGVQAGNGRLHLTLAFRVLVLVVLGLLVEIKGKLVAAFVPN